MSETGKKGALAVVIVLAVGLAIWQGYNLFAGPRPQVVKTMNSGFSAGHTGKQAMMGRGGD